MNSQDKAIQYALNQQWHEAITENISILEINPHDLDALKRLAYAHLQEGDSEKAKEIYKSILTIDPHNPIAKKALNRINSLPNSTKKQTKRGFAIPNFLEEPGRTKVINLINLAPNKTLCKYAIGEEVFLIAKKRSVEIRDDEKSYVGALPDDIAHRLARFIQGGNTYHAYIKDVDKNMVSIFVKESKRDKQFMSTPSFAATNQSWYMPYLQKDLNKDEQIEIETDETDET